MFPGHLEQVPRMPDLSKLKVVARFELLEALRSRLVVVVLTLYGAGAAIGSLLFLKTMAAAEGAARHALAQSTGADPGSLPDDLVRSHALPIAASLVKDAAIRQELVRMPPLSIFYGYMALVLVALLVLATSAGTMASDLAAGTARFTLFRCDRLTWALGKLVGHEIVLAAGLACGAILAGVVGAWHERSFDPTTWLWLLRTSFRAWIYGTAYLGIFSGLSLVARSAMGARVMGLFALIGLGIGHALLASDYVKARIPLLSHLSVVFPAAHRQALWSAEWGSYLLSIVALLAIGALGFGAGYRAFEQRDA